MPYETNQAAKNILGKLAYLLEGAKRLRKIRKYNITIDTDGEIIEDDIIYGMITNSLQCRRISFDV